MRVRLKKNLSSGFSLIEVILALGIAAFCLIPLLGLLPVSLKSYQASNEQTQMVHLARMIVADLQATPTTTTTSPRFGFTIPAAGQGAETSPQSLYFDMYGSPTSKEVGTAPATSISGFPSYFCVGIAFTPPPAGQRSATSVRIMVSWPALADRTPGQWPTHYTDTFQTVITLNRN